MFITTRIVTNFLIFPHNTQNVVNRHFYNPSFTFNNSSHILNSFQNCLRNNPRILLTNPLTYLENYFQIIKIYEISYKKSSSLIEELFYVFERIIFLRFRYLIENQVRQTYLRFLPKSQMVYELDFFEQLHAFFLHVLFLH